VLHRLHEFPILPVRLHRYGVGGRRGWRRHVVWAAGCARPPLWAFTRKSPNAVAEMHIPICVMTSQVNP
jgi:hypothetical protein